MTDRLRSPLHRLIQTLGFGVGTVALIAACGSGGASALPSASAPASAGASSGAAGSCPTSQPAPLAAGEKRTVTIETSKGTIVIEIDGALSPIATGNFVALAECGYYTNVVFHRLVPGFVIQGGDGQFGRAPDVDAMQVGRGGPGYEIQDEPVTAPYARGVVAMARTSAPNSVGSQFFIVLDEAAAQALADPQYNNYQIIGKVTSGMEAVDAIAAMPNSGPPNNGAVEPVPMSKVTVSTP